VSIYCIVAESMVCRFIKKEVVLVGYFHLMLIK